MDNRDRETRSNLCFGSIDWRYDLVITKIDAGSTRAKSGNDLYHARFYYFCKCAIPGRSSVILDNLKPNGMGAAILYNGTKDPKREDKMKTVRMKGKNVEEATRAALAVLGKEREAVEVKILNEGKPAMLGVLGGEDAEVEVMAKEGAGEEAKLVLQNILDKMGFLAMVDQVTEEEEGVSMSVKGEDMGRIIGKEGNMLKALEIIVGTILWKVLGERKRVNIDAGGYREKREKTLQQLADDIAKEVIESGQEKVMPRMTAADRRIIHMFLKDNKKVKTFSQGEGEDRRLVVAPGD